MARLIRCDRCNVEIQQSGSFKNYENVEFPILNHDEVAEDSAKGFDFCFECLKSLWDWFRQGQNDARKR